MINILSNATDLNLAVFASRLAEDFQLDITKIHCRKTGKIIGYRTQEEISLLSSLYEEEKLKGLSKHLNLCDSISPAYAHIQPETLNKLEDIDPVGLFVYYVNLLTRQFNECVTMKGNRVFISVERENQFKNSLVLGHASLLNVTNLEKIKECNNKLRWLLTLNLPKHKFYMVDITGALDFVSLTEKNTVTKQINYLRRNKGIVEQRTLKHAIQSANETGKIVEFTVFIREIIAHYPDLYKEDFVAHSDGKIANVTNQINHPELGNIRSGTNAFYDPKTKLIYNSAETIPAILGVTLRDFDTNPIMPHELCNERGLDWIISYFPKAFKRCKDHIARNKMLGFHENEGINRVFTRGNKTDAISNEFAQYLKDVAQIVASKKTAREFNATKKAVLAAERKVKPLDLSGLEAAADAFLASSLASQKSDNSTVKEIKPLTFALGAKKIEDQTEEKKTFILDFGKKN